MDDILKRLTQKKKELELKVLDKEMEEVVNGAVVLLSGTLLS